MINLDRIYSDTDLFETVTFHSGLNVVLGVPSGVREGRELNGVGKSTLVRLIDYAFVGDSAKKTFTHERCAFLRSENHSFTLSFFDEDRQYRIRRCFAEPDKVYFARGDDQFVEYTESEMKVILAPIMVIDQQYDGHVDTDWFRTLMRFFISDDKASHAQTDPLNFSHSSTRKPFLYVLNYYLLNLPNTELVEFDTLKQRLTTEQSHRKQIEDRIKEESGRTIEQVRSDVDRIESQIEKYRHNLESFEFLEDYTHIEQELRDVTGKIATEMLRFNALQRKLSELEKSYQLQIDVDVERVRRLYASLQEELAEHVARKLDEVIEFRKAIVANRKKFLIEREQRLRSDISEIEFKVRELEVNRKRLFEWLKEQRALDAIRNAYERITHESERIERSVSRLKALDEEEQKIAHTIAEVSDTIVRIVDQCKEYDEQVRDIRRVFDNILRNTIYVGENMDDAFLTISTQNRRTSPVSIKIEVPKSDSLGKSRFKIPVYDLTVFFRIVRDERNLPHFLIHDGTFNAVAAKTVVRFLNYIVEQSNELPRMQYIVTLNEEQVYLSDTQRAELEGLSFDLEKHVIAHYEDVPEKMIFRREY